MQLVLLVASFQILLTTLFLHFTTERLIPLCWYHVLVQVSLLIPLQTLGLILSFTCSGCQENWASQFIYKKPSYKDNVGWPCCDFTMVILRHHKSLKWIVSASCTFFPLFDTFVSTLVPFFSGRVLHADTTICFEIDSP